MCSPQRSPACVPALPGGVDDGSRWSVPELDLMTQLERGAHVSQSSKRARSTDRHDIGHESFGFEGGGSRRQGIVEIGVSVDLVDRGAEQLVQQDGCRSCGSRAPWNRRVVRG